MATRRHGVPVARVLAFVVAAVGLNGVIGYAVTQRTHELAVRIALGARRSDVLRLIVGQSGRLTLVGGVIGTLLAFAGSRWLEPLLFRHASARKYNRCRMPVTWLRVVGFNRAPQLWRADREPIEPSCRIDPPCSSALREL